MTAVFVAPRTFYNVASSEVATAPAVHLRVAEPGMIWRSNGLGGVYVTVGLGVEPIWDTIALVGSNLRATDTIRLRAAHSFEAVATDANLVLDVTFPAWTGTPPLDGALSYYLLSTPTNAGAVRIDINSPGNPAGYVQASRLVIGKRVVTDGVAIGAELSFEDGSNVEEGLGYTSVDRYRVRTAWKVTLDGITDAALYKDWYPFLRDVGRSREFVFIPDTDLPYVQQQAMLCRLTASAKAQMPAGDMNIMELSLLSV